MVCKKCGSELGEGVKFCPSCGNKTGEHSSVTARRKIKPRGTAVIFTAITMSVVIAAMMLMFHLLVTQSESSTNSAGVYAEATKIINALRVLKSSASLCYGDNLVWPKAGEEISLDRYSDKPMVSADPRIFDAVMIGVPYKDSKGEERVNVGVRLIPGENGTKEIQKKLAEKAKDVGLLGASDTLDASYTKGLEVWMNMY
jgi:hypothetical protein